ncbi:hypothetical protein OBK20_09770 [Empedobacter falsenii]|uniref:Uncharacterized protein n=1 Tax=Empedobacter stercoris TaxID=1628248 RepID=A0ABX1WKA7_9FLAO|nr:hypothetical protein [Empedobacter stercoris]MCA4776962.1 hypothetical protein [Empedobacter stercoris]MCA4782422.1 hypothetical protein [Empedobacter stercoris]MCA4809484.1 hypothetical protein [Empedobacter stercoris]NOJ75084.1 hypothetical protein [Empedobacter stercoris]QNT14621.1 hypothetical protein HNV03_08095 [Empedobacter stercoris]
MNKKILIVLVVLIGFLNILFYVGEFFFIKKYSLYGNSNFSSNIVVFFSLLISIILAFVYKKMPIVFRMLILILCFCFIYVVSIIFFKDFYVNVDKALAINYPIKNVDKFYDHNDPIVKLETNNGKIYYYFQKTTLGDIEIPNDEIKNIRLKKSIFDSEVLYDYIK